MTAHDEHAERRREPPTVTETGAPRSAALAPDRPRSVLLVVVGLLAAAGALAVLQRPFPAADLPGAQDLPGPEASLRLVADRADRSQPGALALSVEVDNLGPTATVDEVVAAGAPVRQDPTTSGVSRVPAGDRGRFVVTVQPDCRLLQPGSGISFAASVLVRVRTQPDRRTDIVLDLGRDPVVAAQVAALCRTPT
jgi:hypothetical protein